MELKPETSYVFQILGEGRNSGAECQVKSFHVMLHYVMCRWVKCWGDGMRDHS